MLRVPPATGSPEASPPEVPPPAQAVATSATSVAAAATRQPPLFHPTATYRLLSRTTRGARAAATGTVEHPRMPRAPALFDGEPGLARCMGGSQPGASMRMVCLSGVLITSRWTTDPARAMCHGRTAGRHGRDATNPCPGPSARPGTALRETPAVPLAR